MKKSLLALAALTAFAGVASAQSSVTLFGVVDLNARRATNNGVIYSLSQDGNASSRLGFRGVEDLGGGLRAGFWIEGAINPDTGGTGQTWQRRSTVSLISTTLGEVRLGRDYTPTFWNWTTFDPFGTNGVGAATNLGLESGASMGSSGAYGTLVRSNNTIGYFLPAMGGLYGQAMVSAGEGVAGNKFTGGRIGYGAGPFNVAASYGQTEATFQTDADVYNIAGSYDFGFMKLSAFYGEIDLAAVTQKNYYFGVTVPFGAFTFKGSYGNVENAIVRQSNAAEADQIALGFTYDLSKRTALYGTFSQVSNTKATYSVNAAAAGNASNQLMLGDKKSKGYEVGVRHSF